MAERRMFSKSIIDSDAFLNMPTSSRLLYFDLSMRADDDGFVDSPKKIIRMTGASEDDLKLLIVKQFLIPFESGIVVIKHWRIHNYIQKDRYRETLYLEEKAQLNIKDNKEYIINSNVNELYTSCIQTVNEVDTSCIQNVDNVDTQVRLGKDRLGKDRLGKDRLGNKINYEKIVNLYNEICISLPKVELPISETRKKMIKARLNKYTESNLIKAFQMAEDSEFLKGANKRNWIANIDWILKDSNLPKILEGNYVNKLWGNNNDRVTKTITEDTGTPARKQEEQEYLNEWARKYSIG